MITRWTMTKAWLVGVALIVLAHLLWWVVLMEVPLGGVLRVLLYVLPVLAAFTVAYLAPRQKLLLGMSMSLCGALLGFLAMNGYARLGYHIDNIGGPLATLAILFALHLGYAAVGTTAGYLVWLFASRPR
jgi:hypothetical protein